MAVIFADTPPRRSPPAHHATMLIGYRTLSEAGGEIVPAVTGSGVTVM